MLQITRAYPNQLRLLRKRNLLTQKQLATLVGQRDRTMIQKYESGTAFPPLRVALKLQTVLRTSVSEMFYALHRQLELEVIQARSKQTGPSPLPLNFINR